MILALLILVGRIAHKILLQSMASVRSVTCFQNIFKFQKNKLIRKAQTKSFNTDILLTRNQTVYVVQYTIGRVSCLNSTEGKCSLVRFWFLATLGLTIHRLTISNTRM